MGRTPIRLTYLSRLDTTIWLHTRERSTGPGQEPTMYSAVSNRAPMRTRAIAAVWPTRTPRARHQLVCSSVDA
eukprot:6046263-Prymnesium_polylepis.1